MRRLKVQQTLIILFVCIFAITPVLGMTPSSEASEIHVESNEQETGNVNRPPTEEILQLVEQLQADGAFKNRGAAQSLKAKLNTVIRFEQKGNQSMAEQQFGQFLSMLDQRLSQGFITEEAYEQIHQFIYEVEEPIDTLAIVENGQSQAIIIIAEDPDSVILESANALVEYVEKSTGAVLPVMTTSEYALLEELDSEQPLIYVGTYPAELTNEIENRLQDLDSQGFVIYPSGNTVTIVGPTIFGTRNGAYDFLERYADIRWLMPGPEGVDIPQSSDLVVPKIEVTDEPAFSHRLISAALDSEEWWKANKLQLGTARTIRFQENLYSLFPPEKFLETHPEFYPEKSDPKPGDKHTFQPCFTAEGSVDVAVQGIIDYFDANPNVTSYSLGINDTTLFCETDPDHPHYPNEINSIGFVNMSEIYYAWVNEVVEQVLEVYPDKWFGLLAYYNVMDPPSFPVHPRVVPFITKDRMAWIDDDIRTAGHEQMDAWQEKAEQIGWYDYMYGVHYIVPRVYPHLMAENLQYAKENNVYGHYNEMYHNAGDGPKAWLNAKLMWNPDQDVDALLQEWYERTVGPEAAEDLAALYDYWEDIWTNRMQQSDWFIRNKNSTYLRFEQLDYVYMITKEDFEISIPLMEAVVAKAETDLQKSRAKKLLSMFKYYEASALSYTKDIDPIEDEATALAVLDDIAENLSDRVEYASKRGPLWDEFSNDPILRFRSSRWYEWSGYNRTEFWNLVDYIRNNEPSGGTVTNTVNDLASLDDSSHFGHFVNMLHGLIEGSLPTHTTNSSFEEGSPEASPWTYWNPNGTATIKRVTNIAHSGDASLLVENSTHRAGAYQIFDVQPGLIAAEVNYYSPEGTDHGGVRIVATLQGASGNTLGDYISPTMPLADTAGEWASIGVFEKIPSYVKGEPVKKVLLNAQVWEAEGTQVYLDDVNFHLIKSGEEVEGSMTLTRNSSFEDGFLTVAPWTFWNDLRIGTIERVEEAAHTGNASLKINHLERGGPFQYLEGQSGQIVTQLYYSTPTGTSTNGTVTLTLHALAKNNVRLASYKSEAYRLDDTAGDWIPLSFEANVPPGIDGEAVDRLQVIATFDKTQDAIIYIDDFTVARIEADNRITGNGSFEEGSGKDILPWRFWNDLAIGTMERVEEIARTGDASLKVSSVQRGGPHQHVPAEEGDELLAKLYFYTAEGSDTTTGDVHIVMHALSDNYERLETYRSEKVPLSAAVGEWTPVELEVTVPPAINGKPVTRFQLIATIDKAQEAILYIDDFEVYKK